MPPKKKMSAKRKKAAAAQRKRKEREGDKPQALQSDWYAMSRKCQYIAHKNYRSIFIDVRDKFQDVLKLPGRETVP